MSKDDNRIIPPGQPGSPLFEPSLSMGGGEPDLSRFFEIEPAGGTHFVPAADLLARLAESFPSDRFDRYTFTITDGDPMEGVPEGERAQTLAELIASLKPGESLICLDQSGAQPDNLGLNCKPFVIAGDGLLPVPSPSELVSRICATTDGVPAAEKDRCCGCGGCDKNKS